jgi:hypothetical protein
MGNKSSVLPTLTESSQDKLLSEEQNELLIMTQSRDNAIQNWANCRTDALLATKEWANTKELYECNLRAATLTYTDNVNQCAKARDAATLQCTRDVVTAQAKETLNFTNCTADRENDKQAYEQEQEASRMQCTQNVIIAQEQATLNLTNCTVDRDNDRRAYELNIQAAALKLSDALADKLVVVQSLSKCTNDALVDNQAATLDLNNCKTGALTDRKLRDESDMRWNNCTADAVTAQEMFKKNQEEQTNLMLRYKRQLEACDINNNNDTSEYYYYANAANAAKLSSTEQNGFFPGSYK